MLQNCLGKSQETCQSSPRTDQKNEMRISGENVLNGHENITMQKCTMLDFLYAK